MNDVAGTHPLHHPRYPRSNGYDPTWVFDNQMGPNGLWLMESLASVMSLERGAKVLDLGCGKAMTSIFLAKEFGVRVWATDLWIDASSNYKRILEAGVDDLVVPIHAEAHQLPFAAGFFDAVVSVDTYHYFGTDDLYIGYITGFLRDSGSIGVVAPALISEFGADVPAELAPYWEWEFCSFHSSQWWRTHWERSGRVRVERADAVEDGWRDWLRFDEITVQHLMGWRREAAERSVAMLRADRGRHLGFSRVVATKS